MLLISPQVEMSKEYQVPRDMVLVLDTSGSMRGVKMEQARKALKYCLNNLGQQGPLRPDQLRHHGQQVPRRPARRQRRSRSAQAKKWVDDLEATGGTAIDDALATALELRTERRGPVLHRRLLHRRPADHRRDQHRQDPQEHRRPRTRPTRASSPSASATTSTPRFLDQLAERDAGGQHLRPRRRRTSRPRSAACTARSAIRC